MTHELSEPAEDMKVQSDIEMMTLEPVISVLV
jgi:hypothetical protein